jgi:hypothetical protein
MICANQQAVADRRRLAARLNGKGARHTVMNADVEWITRELQNSLRSLAADGAQALAV